MLIRRIAISAAFAAGVATLSPAAEAQYSPWCNPFPLTWPFCIVGGAAMIITAPFRAFAPPPPYYYGYYGYPPYYYAPSPYGAQPGAAASASTPAYSGQPTAITPPSYAPAQR